MGRKRKQCPLCGKDGLLHLYSHLRDTHGMNSEERQPWLRQAEISRSHNNDEVQSMVRTLSQCSQIQSQMDATTYNSHGSHAVISGSHAGIGWRPRDTIGGQRTLFRQPKERNFQFKHPFTMVIAAPSGFGKTHLTKKILEQADQTIDPLSQHGVLAKINPCMLKYKEQNQA